MLISGNIDILFIINHPVKHFLKSAQPAMICSDYNGDKMWPQNNLGLLRILTLAVNNIITRFDHSSNREK